MNNTLDNWGRSKIRLRSDGENAIRSLKKKVKDHRDAETSLEYSPPGDPKANGESESAVKTVKSKSRVLKAALEKRIGSKILHGSFILPWIIEHAADLVTLTKLGPDGQTPYERIKGKKFKGELIEFGERILYYKIEEQAFTQDLEPRWHQGIWLGFDIDNHQRIIGTPEGIVKANTVKRRPIEERWSREAIEEMRGLPWDKKCRGGGGVRRRKEGEGDKDEEKREPQPRGPCDEPGRPRNFRITKRMIQKFGQTAECPGCATVMKPGRTEAHSEKCRQRVHEELKKTEEGRHRIAEARRRIEEYSKNKKEGQRDAVPYAPHPRAEAVRRRAERRAIATRSMRPRSGEDSDEEMVGGDQGGRSGEDSDEEMVGGDQGGGSMAGPNEETANEDSDDGMDDESNSSSSSSEGGSDDDSGSGSEEDKSMLGSSTAESGG